MACPDRRAESQGQHPDVASPVLPTAIDVYAVEAWVHWQHPDRGLLGAGAFTYWTAEHSGLLARIGRFVMLTADEQFQQRLR